MPFPGIEKLITDLKVFDAESELRSIVEDNKEVLTNYIRLQLSKGFDGDGQQSKIFDKTNYAEETIAIKKSEGVGLGAVTDYVTNFMTGDFYASLKVDVEGNVFDFDSDVPYFGEIRLYSSDAFLKVSEENRKDFAINIVLPEMNRRISERTGLKISNIQPSTGRAGSSIASLYF